jgi:transposase
MYYTTKVCTIASIISKKKKGHIYYYYVESARINGKPRIVNQVYLGTAEGVLKKISDGSITPLYSKVLDFGDVALLYDIATRLDIASSIDYVVGKRNQGLTIGEYIVIAAINRAVCPTSKASLRQWFDKTILSQIMHVDSSLLTSQNYWNNMAIDDDQIKRIEDGLVEDIVYQYNIDTTHIIYDATNFFTYIDTNQTSELALRGHSKEKRNDLKNVGLSMMVSLDFSIPLLYETYPGNRNDAKQFASIIKKMESRFKYRTGSSADITIVFDRGQ